LENKYLRKNFLAYGKSRHLRKNLGFSSHSLNLGGTPDLAFWNKVGENG